LAVDAVFAVVQRGLVSMLHARQLFDRGVGRILAGASIPSRQDLDRLLERVELIDHDLQEVAARVEGLSTRIRAQRATGPRPDRRAGNRRDEDEGWR
jgi:hypothetical protein